MSKENDEVDFLDAMSSDERQKNLLIAGAALISVAAMLGPKLVSLVILLAIFLSSRKPGYNSFMVFFQRWFKETLFPQMSEKLATELSERAKQQTSILGSLKDSAQSFLLSKTTSVRAELAWTSFATTVRPAYRDFYAFRTASVNMGTEDNPAFAVFIGINQEWYLSPHMKLDFDEISVLRMMEAQ